MCFLYYFLYLNVTGTMYIYLYFIYIYIYSLYISRNRLKKYFHTAVLLFKPTWILTLNSSVCGSRTIITTTDHWVMIQRTRGLIIVHHRPSNSIDNRTVQSGGSLWIIDLGIRCHSFVNSRLDLKRVREKERDREKKWSKMIEIIRFRRIHCLFWGKLLVSKSWKSSNLASGVLRDSTHFLQYYSIFKIGLWKIYSTMRSFSSFSFFFLFRLIFISFFLLGKNLTNGNFALPFNNETKNFIWSVIIIYLKSIREKI